MAAATALACAALAFSAGPATRLPALASRMRPPVALDLGTAAQWLADAADTGAILLPDAQQAAANGAQAVAEADKGWFDFFIVGPFEYGLTSLHALLRGAGVQEAWGPAIIMFTLLLKTLTFPLNKKQIESTAKMQAIQPAAKKLQDKYKNADPARLNQELQKLYNDNQVNPLAGCLPSLAQIPIFIGL